MNLLLKLVSIFHRLAIISLFAILALIPFLTEFSVVVSFVVIPSILIVLLIVSVFTENYLQSNIVATQKISKGKISLFGVHLHSKYCQCGR